MKFKLGDLADIKIGVVLSRKKDDSIISSSSRHKVVSLKSFNEDGVYESSFEDEFTPNEKLSNDYFVKKEDLLVRLRYPNHAVYIDKECENLTYTSLIARVRLKDERFNPKFITHFLNSRAVRKQLHRYIVGTAIPMASVANLNNIVVPFMDLDKQLAAVKFLEMARKERDLLKDLAENKDRLTKAIFNELIGE